MKSLWVVKSVNPIDEKVLLAEVTEELGSDNTRTEIQTISYNVPKEILADIIMKTSSSWEDKEDILNNFHSLNYNYRSPYYKNHRAFKLLRPYIKVNL